jgi:hypothetical protein
MLTSSHCTHYTLYLYCVSDHVAFCCVLLCAVLLLFSQQFWGSNLAGVREAPIDFGSEKLNNKLVYSAHIYGKLS